MSRNWIAAGILSLGVVAAANIATPGQAADTLPTTNSATGLGLVSYSFGAYTVQIYSCNETSNGVTVSNDCSNEQVVGTVLPSGSLSLTYENANISNALLNTTVGGAPQDMSFTEVVSTTGKAINGVSLGLTGAVQTTSNITELQDVHTSEVGSGVNINTNMNNGTSPYTVTQYLSTPVTTLTVSKDMAAGSAGGLTGNTIALNTVTQTFNVPEPASLSLLMAGVGGLLGLRRRRARKATH